MTSTSGPEIALKIDRIRTYRDIAIRKLLSPRPQQITPSEARLCVLDALINLPKR